MLTLNTQSTTSESISRQLILIINFLKYCILSYKISQKDTLDPIAPLSAWLIAPVENWKTQILLLIAKMFERWKKNNPIYVEDNLSAKPLAKLIKIQGTKLHQTKYFIFILDLNRTLEGNPRVVKSLFGTLLNLLNEGCKRSDYFGQGYRLKHRVQMGLITAIVPPLFMNHFETWNTGGLLTRVFWISYHYGEDTRLRAQDAIAKEVKVQIEGIN